MINQTRQIITNQEEELKLIKDFGLNLNRDNRNKYKEQNFNIFEELKIEVLK